jgi:hypothetical protein
MRARAGRKRINPNPIQEPRLLRQSGILIFRLMMFESSPKIISEMNQAFSVFHKYFWILLLPITLAGQAQTRLSDIDSGRIPQKTIRKFLKDQGKRGMVYFEDFRPSVDATTDASRFDFKCHHFHLRQTPATAWRTFLTAQPTQIWQGRIISCGFIYSPVSQRVIFPGDNYPGLEPGQIFFVEMRILLGLVKFPVCLVVTEVDPVQRTIAFSYVSSGPSQGTQTIRLIDDGKGETAILHSTIHRTGNVIRDRILYPIYHRKAIGEVHRNIQRQLRPPGLDVAD